MRVLLLRTTRGPKSSNWLNSMKLSGSPVVYCGWLLSDVAIYTSAVLCRQIRNWVALGIAPRADGESERRLQAIRGRHLADYHDRSGTRRDFKGGGSRNHPPRPESQRSNGLSELKSQFFRFRCGSAATGRRAGAAAGVVGVVVVVVATVSRSSCSNSRWCTRIFSLSVRAMLTCSVNSFFVSQTRKLLPGFRVQRSVQSFRCDS